MSRIDALLLSAVLVGTACAPSSRPPDGISPMAGRAQVQNMAVHTDGVTHETTAWPNPGGDGPRGAGTLDVYRSGSAPEPAAAGQAAP